MRRLLILTALLFAQAAYGGGTLVERNPGGDPVFVPQGGVWTTNDLVCVTAPNQISTGGVCNALGGGGGSLTSSGATFTGAACLDNEITTVNGDPSVNSADNLPAGSIVNSCVTRINATLSGGVSIGLGGAADFFGTSGGTVADTNLLDATLPGPARILTAEPVVITSTHSSGLFQNSTGKIRVVCFCDQIGAPTE